MDQWKTDDFCQPHGTNSEKRQRPEVEGKDPIVARKVQKADREKLRRDRLNEHFLELGNALDPDRPKNDKATIINDTIQVLQDLTAEVNRLKAECAALSEESRELTQEKNELREEKAALKSDVDNLNLQYQQRLRVMIPWTAIDPSVVMAPPYAYPVPLPVATGPISMHPAMQPYPFYGNHNPSAIPNPCSTFIPYTGHPNHIDQPSHQCASTSRISSKQDSKSKTLNRCRGSDDDRSDDSNDVVTDLELTMPGSKAQKEQSPGAGKGKQRTRKEKSLQSIADGSPLSRYSSTPGFRDSSSDSIGHREV